MRYLIMNDHVANKLMQDITTKIFKSILTNEERILLVLEELKQTMCTTVICRH